MIAHFKLQHDRQEADNRKQSDAFLKATAMASIGKHQKEVIFTGADTLGSFPYRTT